MPILRKSRKYKGYLIRPCMWATNERWRWWWGKHSGEWVIQAYHHPPREMRPDSECAHYLTLQAAKDAINLSRRWTDTLGPKRWAA